MIIQYLLDLKLCNLFAIPLLCVHKDGGKTLMETYCITFKFLCTGCHNFNQIHLLLHPNFGSVNLIIMVYIQAPSYQNMPNRIPVSRNLPTTIVWILFPADCELHTLIGHKIKQILLL